MRIGGDEATADTVASWVSNQSAEFVCHLDRSEADEELSVSMAQRHPLQHSIKDVLQPLSVPSASIGSE